MWGKRQLRGLAAATALAVAASGCSLLPQSGPNMASAGSAAAEHDIEYTELTIDTVEPFVRQAAADKPLQSTITVGSKRLQLGAGDVLRIQMFETSNTGNLFSGEEGAGVLSRVVVDAAGQINLPYAGRLKAAGMTPAELQSRIADRLSRIAVEPAAYVEVVEDQSNSIVIAGAVAEAGRRSLRDGIAGALDAINAAGGIDGQPWHFDVVLQRGGLVFRRPLPDLLNGGDYPVEPGDRLLVERRPKRFVALGALTTSGAFEFPTPTLTLLDALATARGLSDQRADRNGVYVFRPAEDAAERAHLFSLDMAEPTSIFVADAFEVQPGDAIYVTNAPLTDLNKILEPILRSLAIFRFASDPTGTN